MTSPPRRLGYTPRVKVLVGCQNEAHFLLTSRADDISRVSDHARLHEWTIAGGGWRVGRTIQANHHPDLGVVFIIVILVLVLRPLKSLKMIV